MVKIANIELKNPIVCAPMAGVTNWAFRSLLIQYEPGLYFNEMVSDQAINYRNEKTLKMTEVLEGEHPIAFQLFGSDIESMVRAAQYLDRETNCDIIDINMGCPVQKVVKQGAGSALMKDVTHASELVYRVIQSVDKPVTVKCRSGWDVDSINVVELSKELEKAGASALFVHGRTRSQMYRGQADWSIIKEVKDSVSIPVFGNGDVDSGLRAMALMDETGCDGVMIGRALMKQPWLIKEALMSLNDQGSFSITYEDTLNFTLEHARRLISLMGETVAIKQMRSHGAWALKGLPHSHSLKEKIVKMNSYDDFVRMIEEYKKELVNYERINVD